MTAIQIVNKFRITRPMEVVGLNIMDLTRLNGYWDNPEAAVDALFSWLKNFAVVTEYQISDFNQAPDRGDWPGWSHGTGHNALGRKFWNWFLWYHPEAKLYFSDEPDFCGEYPDGGIIYGDLGFVSVSSFMIAQAQLGKGDVWISVQRGGRRQVMIEMEADRVKRSFRQIGIVKPIDFKTARRVKYTGKEVYQLGLL